MFRMTSLIICSVGIGLTYVTIREWVRNGFDLLPKDDNCKRIYNRQNNTNTNNKGETK